MGNNNKSVSLKTIQQIGGRGITANCDQTLIREVPNSESTCTVEEQRFSATMVNTLAIEETDKVCGLVVSIGQGICRNDKILIVVGNDKLLPAGYDAQHVVLKEDSIDKINDEPYRHLEFVVNLDKI